MRSIDARLSKSFLLILGSALLLCGTSVFGQAPPAAESTITIRVLLIPPDRVKAGVDCSWRLRLVDAFDEGKPLAKEIDGRTTFTADGRALVRVAAPKEAVAAPEVWGKFYLDTDGNGVDEKDLICRPLNLRAPSYLFDPRATVWMEWPGQLKNPVGSNLGAEPAVLNVREFGARGDGAADDTAAIQRAIDRARKFGGTVFLPVGAYCVTSLNLTDLNGVRVSGAGSGHMAARLVPTRAGVNVLDLTGSRFVVLENFHIGPYPQMGQPGTYDPDVPIPKTAILLAPLYPEWLSNALHFENLVVTGKYSVATLYCFGVCSSDMVNCDFYNYNPVDAPVVWFTGVNAAGMQSDFGKINPQGSANSDWTLTACEIHELSKFFIGRPSPATALRLTGAQQMRWVGGNISSEGPHLIKFEGDNHHIAFVGTTLYSELGSAPAVTFYNSKKVSGLSVGECVITAREAVFGGAEGAIYDEVVLHSKPATGTKRVIDCPQGTLTNSSIHCDGLGLRAGTIATSILINPGPIEAQKDSSLKVK